MKFVNRLAQPLPMLLVLVALAQCAFVAGCGRKSKDNSQTEKTTSNSKLESFDKSTPRYLIKLAFLAHGGDKIESLRAGEISTRLIVHAEDKKFDDSTVHSKFQRPQKLTQLELHKVSNETEDGTFVKAPGSKNSIESYLRIGKQAWIKRSDDNYLEVPNLREIARLQPLETISELRVYIESDLEFVFLEPETIAGKQADVIEFSKEGVHLGTLAFDKETHFLVQFTKPTYDPRTEKDVNTYNRYSDFQTVAGITYAAKMVSHLDEFFFLEQTIQEFKACEKLDGDYFKVPD